MGMIDHFVDYDGNFFNIEDVELVRKNTHKNSNDQEYGTIYIKGGYNIYFPSEKYDEIITKILTCNAFCRIMKS